MNKSINYNTGYALNDEYYASNGVGGYDRPNTPTYLINQNRARNKIYHVRQGRVVPVTLDEPHVLNYKEEEKPRDIDPLPKAATYHLRNQGDARKNWQTVKMFERETYELEQRDAKLKLYRIAPGNPREKTPTPVKIPRYKVFAINNHHGPTDDSLMFNHPTHREERVEHHVVQKSPPRQQQRVVYVEQDEPATRRSPVYVQKKASPRRLAPLNNKDANTVQSVNRNFNYMGQFRAQEGFNYR